MGQRLNIEIVSNGVVLANAYYHWSAYTNSSAMLMEEIVHAVDLFPNETELGRAVRLLELTNAGVNENEYKRIKEDKSGKFAGIRFQNAIDRNEGLLSVTEYGMDETRKWEEGRVTIDIGIRSVAFSVYWSETLDDYEENYDQDPMDLPKRDFNFADIPFDKIDELEKLLDECPDGFRDNDGYVYTWIS